MAMPAALLLQQLLLLSQHADTGHRPSKPALGFNHCSIDCCSPDMPSARFMQARPPVHKLRVRLPAISQRSDTATS